MRFSKTIGLLTCIYLCSPQVFASSLELDTAPFSSTGWTVYSGINLWRAFDPIPIDEIESDWSKGYSPKRGRNSFIQRGRAEFGVSKDGWRLGWEIRQDAFITTNRSTLDALYIYKQRLKPSEGSVYDLAIKSSMWQASGVRVGRTFTAMKIAAGPAKVDVSAALYGGDQRLRQIDLNGSLAYLNADSYTFDVKQTEAKSSMSFPFMDKAPSVSGASFTAAATIPLSEAWTFTLKVEDLFSRIQWKNLPITDQSLNSNVTSYDENGYINYRPLLSGRNRQVNRTIRLEQYTEAVVAYNSGPWNMSGQLAHYVGEYIPTLLISYQFPQAAVQASYETRFGTVGLGVKVENFILHLQADTLDLDKAKSQGLQLSYHFTF